MLVGGSPNFTTLFTLNEEHKIDFDKVWKKFAATPLCFAILHQSSRHFRFFTVNIMGSSRFIKLNQKFININRC